MTQAAKLPPLSTTPAANFATIFASAVDTAGKFATGVNNTGGKFATSVNDASGKLPLVSTTPVANNGKNYQTADNLKWTWKKNYLYANPTTQRCPKENIKNFLIKDFFLFATGVNDTDTGGKPWAVNISANFRKNSKRP